MIRLSPVLVQHGAGRVGFWCPGCDQNHSIPVAISRNPGKAWGYNGDPEKPTFDPSIKITSGHYVDGHKPDQGCWCDPDPDGEPWGFSCGICHSFVIDGRIQFLDDCTHALKGQTVDLPRYPDEAGT